MPGKVYAYDFGGDRYVIPKMASQNAQGEIESFEPGTFCVAFTDDSHEVRMYDVRSDDSRMIEDCLRQENRWSGKDHEAFPPFGVIEESYEIGTRLLSCFFCRGEFPAEPERGRIIFCPYCGKRHAGSPDATR